MLYKNPLKHQIFSLVYPFITDNISRFRMKILESNTHKVFCSKSLFFKIMLGQAKGMTIHLNWTVAE